MLTPVFIKNLQQGSSTCLIKPSLSPVAIERFDSYDFNDFNDLNNLKIVKNAILAILK